ncbi:MAG: PhzF family phenazine biosynthesis protein [Erythrobacter sp.]
MLRSFKMVDVFATEPFTGNPVAVIADAQDLTTEEMQRITRWLNLSETTFLLPPTNSRADYRVRIFTLARELPFAGHPTLGTCHAWLEAGGQPKRGDVIVQECGAGLIEIRRVENELGFAAPALIRSGAPTEAEIARATEVLRIERSQIIDAQWADNGPGWLVIMLASAAEVLAAAPLRHYPERIDIGLVGPYPEGSEAAFELRAIFSGAHGELIEDPVTGSLNASVGQWLFEAGHARGEYSARQGTVLGRSGRIRVSEDENGRVWVAGRTETLFGS